MQITLCLRRGGASNTAHRGITFPLVLGYRCASHISLVLKVLRHTLCDHVFAVQFTVLCQENVARMCECCPKDVNRV